MTFHPPSNPYRVHPPDSPCAFSLSAPGAPSPARPKGRAAAYGLAGLAGTRSASRFKGGGLRLIPERCMSRGHEAIPPSRRKGLSHPCAAPFRYVHFSRRCRSLSSRWLTPVHAGGGEGRKGQGGRRGIWREKDCGSAVWNRFHGDTRMPPEGLASPMRQGRRGRPRERSLPVNGT